MMVRLKGESTPINFNRPKKVDKLNENKKKTSGLQIFPPINVNGSSKINTYIHTYIHTYFICHVGR